MSIKKILKDKLIETKEKKSNLLQESNIVKNRFNFILESSQLKTKKHLKNVFEKTLIEAVNLHEQGFSEKIISENLEGVFTILNTVFKGKDDDIKREFRDTGVNMVLSSLNLDDSSDMKMHIEKALKSTDSKDVTKLLTDYKFLSDKLAEASVNAFVEHLSQEIGEEFMDVVNSSIKEVIRSSDLKDKISDRTTRFTRPLIDRINQKLEDKLKSVKSSLIPNSDIQA